jgi:carbohydrate kinase (thermoresistant glucokinase family)
MAEPPTPTRTRIVVMGVSGSGKSVVGARLAEKLGFPFMDADDLHSAANKAKMAGGTPLTDTDRWPWLDTVGAAMAAENSVVMACSALRRAYRDRLRASAPDVYFIELTGTTALLEERIGARTGHFMPSSLLASQLAMLENLARDEPGFTVDVTPSIASVVATIVNHLATAGTAPASDPAQTPESLSKDNS